MKTDATLTRGYNTATLKHDPELTTDVEDVINASGLTVDEQSALWLLAWSYVHPRAQRREAIAHLDRLTAATSPPAINRPRHLRVAG